MNKAFDSSEHAQIIFGERCGTHLGFLYLADDIELLKEEDWELHF